MCEATDPDLDMDPSLSNGKACSFLDTGTALQKQWLLLIAGIRNGTVHESITTTSPHVACMYWVMGISREGKGAVYASHLEL